MIFFHANPTFHNSLHACAVDPATLTSRKNECANTNRTHDDTQNKKKNEDKPSTVGFVLEKTPMHREETSQKTILSFDVAGFDEAHLGVEIDNHILTITGERTNKLGDTFVFRRRLALKVDIYDEGSISATLNEGILEVTITKKLVSKNRKVTISVGVSAASPESRASALPAQSDSSTPATTNETTPINTHIDTEGTDPTAPTNHSTEGAWEHVVDE